MTERAQNINSLRFEFRDKIKGSKMVEKCLNQVPDSFRVKCVTKAASATDQENVRDPLKWFKDYQSS